MRPSHLFSFGIFCAFTAVAFGADAPPKVQSVGDAAEFLVPPAPWAVDEEHSTDTQRYYQWMIGEEGMGDIAVLEPHDFAEGDNHKTAAQVAASRKEGAGEESGQPVKKVEVTTENGVSKAHFRMAWGQGYADRTEIYRDLPDHRVVRVDATIYVAKPNGPHVAKVIEATRKLAQEIALSVAPKGKVNASTVLAFDAKAILARPPGAKHEGVEIGDTPDLKSVNAVNNKTLSLADYRGKVVVVDFWATWCGPCMAEAGHMVELNEKYSPQGVQLVGVSLDDDRKGMLEVAKNSNFTWPQVFGGNGWKSPPAVAWGVQSIPCTFVLSPEGEVVWRGHPGNLESALKMALQTYPPHEVKPKTAEKPAAAEVAAKPVAAKQPEVKTTDSKPPVATEVKPAAPANPAGALAAARKMKSTQPAEAYAALAAIAKASPYSAEGKSAKQDMAAMEGDEAVAKKVMTSEGRAYSAYSMAKNFAASGQTDKAKERFDQVVKDYPDTMCAAMAKKQSAELAAAAK
jgi:thiol-disulfide isomerase/thioredoxin